MASTAVAASPTVLAAIDQAARDTGVDPVLARSVAQHESGYSPTIIGDHGCSHGLFQLNTCGGEGAGMTLAQLEDPYTNAHRALTQIAAVAAQHPNWSPGRIAAAAQRPADPSGYANIVDGIYTSLLGVIPSTTGSPGSPSVPGVVRVVDVNPLDAIGSLWGALQDYTPDPLGINPQGGGAYGDSVLNSDKSNPLSLGNFAAAARDAIQIAAGLALIYLGVIAIMAELGGAPIGKTGRRVNTLAQRGYGTARSYTPREREAERQRKEVESRTPEEKAEMRAEARRQRRAAERSQDTGYRPRRPKAKPEEPEEPF